MYSSSRFSCFDFFFFGFCYSTVKDWLKNKNSDPRGGNVMAVCCYVDIVSAKHVMAGLL